MHLAMISLCIGHYFPCTAQREFLVPQMDSLKTRANRCRVEETAHEAQLHEEVEAEAARAQALVSSSVCERASTSRAFNSICQL